MVASLYKRNNLIEIVRKVASSVFIPLTVGGGIRTLDDVRLLLSNGADKITLNTAAIENPKLISDISNDEESLLTTQISLLETITPSIFKLEASPTLNTLSLTLSA